MGSKIAEVLIGLAISLLPLAHAASTTNTSTILVPEQQLESTSVEVSNYSPVEYEATLEEKIKSGAFTIPELHTFVYLEALKYHVSPALAFCIVDHESKWDPEAVGDKYLGPGNESYGIFQINHFHNPEVSPEEAKDPVFAAAWALPRLKTNPYLWSTYTDYCL